MREDDKSAKEHYKEAARRNAYSVGRCTSAYHGRMLEAGSAFNAMPKVVFREWSSNVCSCVKDWREFIVIGMSDRADDHAHRREAELEAVGSEWAALMVDRIAAMRHTEDLGGMRKEAGGPINSGESVFGYNSGGTFGPN